MQSVNQDFAFSLTKWKYYNIINQNIDCEMISMKLSLVVPCYNEAENVGPFQEAVIGAYHATDPDIMDLRHD